MTENSYIPRVYNNGNRTWETMVIPSQMCLSEEEREQTKNHLIFQCKKLCNQRNEMIKQKTPVAIGLR